LEGLANMIQRRRNALSRYDEQQFPAAITVAPVNCLTGNDPDRNFDLSTGSGVRNQRSGIPDITQKYSDLELLKGKSSNMTS